MNDPVRQMALRLGVVVVGTEGAGADLRAVADVLGTRPVPAGTRAVRSTHPAEVLVEESRRAGLIIVGTRGHGAARAALLGSVSADVVRDAACPVVVMPPGLTER